MKPDLNKYTELLDNIGQTIEIARQNAFKAVNTELVKANWELLCNHEYKNQKIKYNEQIGRHIVEFEQHGNERAEYGSVLLVRLSTDLRLRYGKGYGRRNVLDMRRFYLAYPIWQPVVAKLRWSHIIVLWGISDDTARISLPPALKRSS